ncbi:MAG: penicillin-binding protein 2 [Phycisphaerales bacterium]|jgi:penicillin-binding protein 2
MFKHLILFYRRLLVLSVVCMMVLLALVYQAAKLTVSEGDARFVKAQGRLHSTTYLPTWRGRIQDRNGNVLAEDIASYSVSVDWDVITGDRALRFAREDAKTSIGNKQWQSISPEERQSYVDAYLPGRLSEMDGFWNTVATTGGVKRQYVEKQLQLIRQEVEQTAAVVWVRQEEMHKKRYGDSVPFVANRNKLIKEQNEPHVVLAKVSDENAIAFELLSAQFDNVLHVEHSRQRDYPSRTRSVLVDRSTLPKPMRTFDAIEVVIDDVAELIIGNVRNEVWAKDVSSRPFRTRGVVDLSGYRAGDEVGTRGIEKSMERVLRGARGKIVLHRSGEELSRTDVQGGRDVQVTLDIALQARVEAAMSPELGLMEVQAWHNNAVLPIGTPLRGAVVVLDVETSEVLAMVSTPTLRDTHDVDGYPWLNRAAEGLYPPGSIIKPLVLAAATTEGKFETTGVIECVGHYFKNVKNAARCWIYRDIYDYRTHGELGAVEALARSCNIFFYELGTRLGFETLVDWLQRFGMSQPLSSGLTSEKPIGTLGHVPSEKDIEELRNRGALAFETVSISIGQGALTWSPLHAASAYATLARGGMWIAPTLVEGNVHPVENLHLDQEGVRLALHGLRDSIAKQYGTGSRLRFGGGEYESTFNVDGVRLWGKTGTAEAPPYKLRNDSPPINGLDHSWFLVMASPMDESTPKIVVAVLVEHGGSGGRVAGPIANQIIHAIKVEGYLD